MNNCDFLFNYRRLRHIKRCNNFFTLVPEDVAQHSYYTAIIVYTIATEYNEGAENYNKDFHPLDVENLLPVVNVQEAVMKALFHDVEESFTSDIPFNVKHHDSEITKEIQRCIQEKLDKIFATRFKDHLFLNRQAKEGLEGEFVAIADFLEGAWSCYEELQLGNKTLMTLLSKYCELIEKSTLHSLLLKYSKTYASFFTTFFDLSKRFTGNFMVSIT